MGRDLGDKIKKGQAGATPLKRQAITKQTLKGGRTRPVVVEQRKLPSQKTKELQVKVSKPVITKKASAKPQSNPEARKAKRKHWDGKSALPRPEAPKKAKRSKAKRAKVRAPSATTLTFVEGHDSAIRIAAISRTARLIGSTQPSNVVSEPRQERARTADQRVALRYGISSQGEGVED